MKNRNIYFLIGFLLFLIKVGLAQSAKSIELPKVTAKRAIYLGYSLMNDFSLNIDQILFQNRRSAVGAAIGFASGSDIDRNFIVNGKRERLPFQGLLLKGYYRLSDRKLKHHFDLGVGFNVLYKTLRTGTYYSSSLTGMVVLDSTQKAKYFGQIISYRLAYRKQNPIKGFFYTIGITPLIHESFFYEKFLGIRFLSEWGTSFVPYFDIGLGWSF